jgi:molybdate/tungstate transport system substrate-binding protein
LRSRVWSAGLVCCLLAFGLGGCGTGTAPQSAAPHTGSVDVLYAGSLVDVMENAVGPAFHKATGYTLEGIAAGSTELAAEIKGKLRQGDVFISAAPAVNRTLEGPKNSNWVSWYLTFAQAPLVIGYNPGGRFASALKTKPWWEVMQEPGFRLGRTDPKLDPKGLLTLQAVAAAATYYHQPDLAQHVLGSAENPAQVFPEEDLVGRLQTGQLDAGFFYSNEAVQAHIPIIRLPKALHFAATFTVTILRRAPHAAAAKAFVGFLLSAQGQSLLRQDGLTVVPYAVSGSAPAGLPIQRWKALNR